MQADQKLAENSHKTPRLRPKLLVVDDCEELLLLYGKMLRRLGWQPSLASSGSEALTTIELERPDILLIDQRMPEISGTEVIRLAWQRKHQFIPILITAVVDVAEISEKNGISFFLSKPFLLEDLRRVLDRAVLALGGFSHMDLP